MVARHDRDHLDAEDRRVAEVSGHHPQESAPTWQLHHAAERLHGVVASQRRERGVHERDAPQPGAVVMYYG